MFEDQQIQGPAGYGRVGNVEYELEKDKAAAAPDGEVFGQDGVNQRKVEHVYYFAVQKCTVAAFRRKHLGDLGDAGFVEDQSVESAVYYVANGSYKDQRKTYQDAHRGFGFFQQPDYVPHDKDAQSYTEQAQNEFAGFSAKDHAKGHAFIFHKKQLEPSAQNRNALVKGKVGFYPDLRKLIQNKNGTDNNGCDLTSGYSAFPHGTFILYCCSLLLKVLREVQGEGVLWV